MQAIEKQEIIGQQLRFAIDVNLDLLEATDVTFWKHSAEFQCLHQATQRSWSKLLCSSLLFVPVKITTENQQRNWSIPLLEFKT